MTISVYDALGREVAVVLDGDVREGSHSLPTPYDDLSVGTYTCHLRSANQASSIVFTVAR